MRNNNNEHQARANKHTNTESALSFLNEGNMADLLKGKTSPLILVLDCIQDPHNLGACLRTAAAAGCDFVVIPKDKSAPITDTVRRIACGGAESVPIVRVTNLARTMDDLKEMGVWFVGTADEAKQSLYDVDMKGGIGIVMGAEGEGMRRLTGERCDFLVKIPMSSGPVPCLNVSVATGVCLFEAVRQRKAKKQ
ncbi:MAG: rRNA ((2251)-2-O)-methyltransferase RlmB [Verrucomicrobiota bacterium]|jgi:23S rRNA (guanosine2251-2'-O)-methyltransferase